MALWRLILVMAGLIAGTVAGGIAAVLIMSEYVVR